MQFGAVFPTSEIGDDPAAIRDYVQTAEGLGYSHILAYDHVLGAVHEGREPPLTGPYTEDDAFHEPLTLFAYLAGVTSKIRFKTGVLILPQRQAVLVAKQAAEIQNLSGGRLELGVGLGWNPVEYESLGQDFSNKGARLEEQIDLLRQLWREPLLDFEGRFHRVDRAGLKPRPSKPIPIWMGGSTPRAAERAARLTDGFIFSSHGKMNQGVAQTLPDALAANGRDLASFGIEVLIGYGRGPDSWRAAAEQWEGLGAGYLSMRSMSTGGAYLAEPLPNFTTPGQHIEALEVFMREMTGP